jgi:hypothetical protein
MAMNNIMERRVLRNSARPGNSTHEQARAAAP